MALYDLEKMLRKFGNVTVMDVEFYKTVRFAADSENGDELTGEWDAKSTFAADNKKFSIKTLKIANINQEGPTKSITGGMNNDVLLKYGKTYSIEMQDALGDINVMEQVYGANISSNKQILSFTDRFPSELTIVGRTFVIDQSTGAKQPINIIIPIYLGDGIFNLQQQADGDSSVFDLNGNILKFNSGVATTSEETGLYGPGGDNEFYFFCTDQGYASIVAEGYEAAKSTEQA